MSKKILLAIMFLTAFVTVFCYSYIILTNEGKDLSDIPVSIPPRSASRIAPFEYKAKFISFEELIQLWNEKGIVLYLPTQLPKDLKPVGVWVEKDDDCVGSLAIFIYSKEGRDTIATAELVIEVFPTGGMPFTPQSSTERFDKINEWQVYINEKAPVGWKDYHDLYGSYVIVLDVYIEPLNYIIRGSPILSMDDMITLVESIKITK